MRLKSGRGQAEIYFHGRWKVCWCEFMPESRAASQRIRHWDSFLQPLTQVSTYLSFHNFNSTGHIAYHNVIPSLRTFAQLLSLGMPSPYLGVHMTTWFAAFLNTIYWTMGILQIKWLEYGLILLCCPGEMQAFKAGEV